MMDHYLRAKREQEAKDFARTRYAVEEAIKAARRQGYNLAQLEAAKICTRLAEGERRFSSERACLLEAADQILASDGKSDRPEASA